MRVSINCLVFIFVFLFGSSNPPNPLFKGGHLPDADFGSGFWSEQGTEIFTALRVPLSKGGKGGFKHTINSFHYNFRRLSAHADEIHPCGQVRHVDGL